MITNAALVQQWEAARSRASLSVVEQVTHRSKRKTYLLLDVLLLLVVHGLETLGDLLEKSLGLEVSHCE